MTIHQASPARMLERLKACLPIGRGRGRPPDADTYGFGIGC